jgi:hypothetical protein
VLSTFHDDRLARRKGRPIAPHHLARLFARRWYGMSEQFAGLDKQWFLRRLLRGRQFVGKGKKSNE